jgi:hypothetical protein
MVSAFAVGRGGHGSRSCVGRQSPRHTRILTKKLLTVNYRDVEQPALPRDREEAGCHGQRVRGASPRGRGKGPFVVRASRAATGHPRCCGEHPLFTGLVFMVPPPQPSRGPDQAGPALNFRPHAPPHPVPAADVLPTRISIPNPGAVPPVERS